MPVTAHWSSPDPILATGQEWERKRTFVQVFAELERRLGIFMNLPFASLDRMSPQNKLDDYCIMVGVFIHWEAASDQKIYDYNYQATKEAIQRALANKPSAAEVVAAAKTARHPFASNAEKVGV